VFEPGLYTLTMRNTITRIWSQPCSLTVQSGRAGAPVITGPTSTCTGTPADWCGPAGSFEYAWNGPNGFTASTQCVSLTGAGDYFLRVRSLPGGCWGDSTVQALAVTSCGPGGSNCPRPAWWWAHQCSERDRRHGRLDRTQVAAVAGCVDDHASALSWYDDASGFTRTVKHERRTLRMRARRQFATVWANVCAGQLGVTPRSGPPVGLDAGAALDATLGGGTVASWLALADAELARLEVMPERSAAVKESYRRLIRSGWQINHGRGIGTTCRADLLEDAHEAVAEGLALTEADLESLDGELVDDGDGPLVFGVFEPNPFNSQTALAYAVSSTTSAPVSIAVYDVSGRLVRELVRGQHAPGQYVAHWDGTTTDGARVRSGLYFVRGRIGDRLVQSRVSVIR
jgi:hypothetical protein